MVASLNRKRFTVTVADKQDPLPLASGQALAPVTLQVETYGHLNADRSNAILLCHALTGDATAARDPANESEPVHPDAGQPQQRWRPGWWQRFVGPDLSLDTRQFFIVSVNVLGSCNGSTGPLSTNPATGRPYGLSFPMVTIQDMVDAQARLLKALSLPGWYAVVGGSLGGFQALDWALRYPQQVQRLVIMASAAQASAQAIGFNAVGRHAISNDPAWQQGHYPPDEGPQHGLATARMLAHITYLSEEALQAKFGRRRQSPEAGLAYNIQTDAEFAVESYLGYQGRRFTQRFDANAYLYLTKAMDYFDLTEGGTVALHRAVAPLQATTLLLSYSSDWLFPPAETQRLARALRQAGKTVSYLNLPTQAGHDAFLLEHDAMTPILKGFLRQ